MKSASYKDTLQATVLPHSQAWIAQL